MITILHGPQSRTWNPDSRLGENSISRRSLKRRDLWFFCGILAFMVLLFFVWQQHRGLRLADEVAHLEARKEAARARLVEMGVEVTRLRQPDQLLGSTLLASQDGNELNRRVFVAVRNAADTQLPASAQDTWLASVGLELPRALAADRP